MKRMPRRKAIAVERRANLENVKVRNEWPLAYPCSFQRFIDHHTDQPGRDIHRQYRKRLNAINQQERETRGIPECAIPQPADDREEHADNRALTERIQRSAETYISREGFLA